MHRIGMQLLQERKAEIMRMYGEEGTGADEKKDVMIEADMGRRRSRVQVRAYPFPVSHGYAEHLITRCFRPERWKNPPKSTSAIPGVWGNLLAFLGGAHACIGYRFSLVEYVLPRVPAPTHLTRFR